jgi:hypothetical protein
LQELDKSTVTGPRIATYPQFWLFYLREHAKPSTRAWHYVGTSLTILCVLGVVALRQPWLLFAAVVVGYGPAWIAHFTVEKNKPATFRYPLWSLYSDFRMLAVWLSGRLPRDLEAAGVTVDQESQKAGSRSP